MKQSENLFFRQTAILSGDDAWLVEQFSAFFAHNQTRNQMRSAVYCAAELNQDLSLKTSSSFVFYPFSHAKNLLGQEFDCAVYDTRQAGCLNFNLEALAIVAATIKAGGVLLILLPTWGQWQHLPDFDSLRWNGTSDAIMPSHFYRWLQNTIESAVQSDHIRLYRQDYAKCILPTIQTQHWQLPDTALAQQNQVLQQILAQQYDLYLLTAARGRGKSALAGMLAEKLTAKLADKSRVILTAANQSAVQTLYRHSLKAKPHFIAPDDLIAQLTLNPQQFAQDWLIIDEAAMIPLPMLATISRYFRHILLTTTIQGYEGTGRGFELKFKQLLNYQLNRQLKRSYSVLQLQQPLRYPENDPLEQWINYLLLLNEEISTTAANHTENSFVFEQVEQAQLVEQSQQITEFYHLLTLAHYRTSPLDLRRLLDAQGQQFWILREDNKTSYQQVSTQKINGGIWALAEGGIIDQDLIDKIWRGERRPPGNLLAQALCFQADLPSACALSSIRISRIALLPHLQRQGLGRRLVEKMVADCRDKVDFISVSFGYEDALYDFWQKCGFEVVHISNGIEASSGCFSAMALYPLSVGGEQLFQQAKRQFLRDFPLTEHPLFSSLGQRIAFPAIDWQLNGDDQRQLQGFAHTHRTLASTYPALRRLLYTAQHTAQHTVQQPHEKPHFIQLALMELQNLLQDPAVFDKKIFPKQKLSKKQRLNLLRQAVAKLM